MTDVHHVAELTTVSGTLFFTTWDDADGMRLWKTDGTTAGTVLIKDPAPTSDDNVINDLTAVGGHVFFTADDAEYHRRLWKSDGTAAGTHVVKDVNPDDRGYLAELTNVHGLLFFLADDGTHGRELWKSDGTRSGTRMVRDIAPGTATSRPYDLTALGSTLFFAADNGSGDPDRDLWKSDGTAEGTVLVKDIGPNVEYDATYDPNQLTALGKTLFFVGDDDLHGPGLWKSDGTTAGTVLVKDTTPGSDHTGYYDEPTELVPLGKRLFFTAHDDRGEELWVSNGTDRGTHIVKDVRPGPASGVQGATDPRWVHNLAAFDDQMFFTANDGTHGLELWKTDGTESGTIRLTSLPEYHEYPYYLPWQRPVFRLTVAGDALYFVGNDGVHDGEVWSSDGTRKGTTLVADVRLGETSLPDELTPLRGTLFFTAFTTQRELALWKVIGPGKSCAGVAATITGSGHVRGTAGDDVIMGSPGADTIRGRGGQDRICGGGGNDTLIGGTGRDEVRGNGGRDEIDLRDGVPANDTGDGGPGRDTAHYDIGDPDDPDTGDTVTGVP